VNRHPGWGPPLRRESVRG